MDFPIRVDPQGLACLNGDLLGMKGMDAGHHIVLSEESGRQGKQNNGLGNISRHTDLKPAVRAVRSGTELKAAALKTVNHGYGEQKSVNVYGFVFII